MHIKRQEGEVEGESFERTTAQTCYPVFGEEEAKPKDLSNDYTAKGMNPESRVLSVCL